MSQVWFTADTHFGHRNILTLGSGRPFSTIEEHDEALVERWNEVVRPQDTVWHLGDVALSLPHVERCVPQLNGHKYLVAGNHDLCWAAHPSQSRRAGVIAKTARYRAAGFERVQDSGIEYGQKIGGRRVVLSHLPADGDHESQQRYDEQRPRPLGMPIVCAHVHEAWKVNGQQVNVGVDQWGFRPVHIDEVAAILAHVAPSL